MYLTTAAAVMGLVPHHALVASTAPFVAAFGTIFSHGAWAGKLVAALAVTSGIGALNGWTLRASVEGGDVHVLGHGTVLIGMGERTTPMAAEILARALIAAGQARTVIVIELPRSHAMMHLDTVMTMRRGRTHRIRRRAARFSSSAPCPRPFSDPGGALMTTDQDSMPGTQAGALAAGCFMIVDRNGRGSGTSSWRALH